MTRSRHQQPHFPHQKCETEIGKLIENELVKCAARSLTVRQGWFVRCISEVEEICKVHWFSKKKKKQKTLTKQEAVNDLIKICANVRIDIRYMLIAVFFSLFADTDQRNSSKFSNSINVCFNEVAWRNYVEITTYGFD